MPDLHGFELGPLEADVMRVVWDKGEAVGVAEVHQALGASRQLAYTTVMTVMTRLTNRGLLERRKEGRAYVYSPAVPREELAGNTLQEWAARYWGGRIMPAISMLLGSERLSPEDVQELRRLVEELERKEGC
jgi:BlaI family penicillinase repressor